MVQEEQEMEFLDYFKIPDIMVVKNLKNQCSYLKPDNPMHHLEMSAKNLRIDIRLRLPSCIQTQDYMKLME